VANVSLFTHGQRSRVCPHISSSLVCRLCTQNTNGLLINSYQLPFQSATELMLFTKILKKRNRMQHNKYYGFVRSLLSICKGE